MRIVAAAVYPELDANTAFHNVYKALLGKQRLNQPIWVPFLDLLRCTRNTIHNNGIYTPAKRGEQGPIRWQGRQYVFRPGQAIDFFSWSFLFHCFHDMDRFLAFFIGHPVISALPMIRDPVAESE